MELSDLCGLQAGVPASLFHSVHLGLQLLLAGHKVWPLYEQQMGPWL